MNESPRNARILIVDDTLQNIQVLGTILKGKNYQINVARNGIEALDMVERARPDLILLEGCYLGGIRKVVSCSTWSRKAMVKVVL